MVADRGPVTSGVTLSLAIVATVFVAARFYTRAYIVRSIKKDDWWILAAWICAIGFSAAICVGVSDGLGRHWDDVPPAEKDNFRRAQYAYSVLYNPCLMLSKTSIIVFYLSVMSKDVDPIFRWLNWLTLAVVNLAGTALTLLTIFQCRNPISAGYTYPQPETAVCTNIVTLYLSSAPVNILTDLALLLLPMPILTGLRLPKKQKIILVATFSAGIFVAVVDVVRIAYLQNAAIDRFSVEDTPAGNAKIVETSDFSWYASLSFMWSAIEVNIGIICACVPSLKGLFLKFAPSFIKDDNDTNAMSSVDVVEKGNNAILETTNVEHNIITNPAAFRRPTCAEYDGNTSDEDDLGFLQILAAPGNDAPSSPRTQRNSSRLTRTTTVESRVSEFNFVTMDKSRNMLKLTNKQSLWPCATVTVIFFLWGFAYGLLSVLNAQFQTIAKLSSGQVLSLHGAYYAGYFIGPLTLSRWLLFRYGFKSCMMAGLCVYGAGTLVFWPSAVLTSFVAFVISNFIVGFGLSCLESASNPYIALCGPSEYMEVRLNLSQAFQAVGSVVSPLLATKVLFRNVLDAPSLVDVQWTYLGISLFVFLLAIAFYYIPLPEATSEQLEEATERRSAVYRTRVGPLRVVWWTLILGVFSQWCYVGAQEALANDTGGLIPLVHTQATGLGVFDLESTIPHTTFAVGRFIGAVFNYLIKPRWILMACFTAVVILCALQMSAEGASALTINGLIFFFEGSIFPIVYAISMRGMGDQTFNAAAVMTSAISGGAVFPPIVWAVSNLRGAKYSFCTILAIYAFGAIFPIYLNLLPAARKQVDPIHESRDHRRQLRRAARNASITSAGSAGSIDKRFGLQGILARRKAHHVKHNSGSSHMPTTEHIEKHSPPGDMSPVSPRTSRWNDDAISFPCAVRTKSGENNVEVLGPWQNSLSETGNSKQKDWAVSPSHSSSDRASGASSHDVESLPPQEKRAWTEEDDVRADYHDLLKKL